MVVTVEEEPALGAPEEDSPPLSPSDDEEDDEEETDSEGDGAGGGAPPLKKGPWTPEEDKRLKEYVEAHGEGNWNQVQRNAGLNRCGKSCRLRWANHLRPDLKKGPFDDQEVDKIIQMHHSWGNKWAKMAACLPGRTDNEIKNFWNTRLKRHQRADLPMYPEYLASRVSNEDISCHTPDETHGLKRSNEFSLENVLDFNELMEFTVIDYDNHMHDLPVSSLVIPRNPLKRHVSTGCIVSDYNGNPEETENTICSIDFNYGMTKSQLAPLSSAIASGHPIFDGNPSTSGTIQKTELPSFQYSSYDYSNVWLCEGPSGPPIEQVDTFIQSPGSDFNSFKSESISSQNTDWMDAMVHKVDGLDPTNSHGFLEVSVPPLSYNQVSQSNAYPMRHSYSVLGDCELEGDYFDEIQASNSPSGLDAIFPFSNYYPDAIFPSLEDTGMHDALEASFMNEGSLLPKEHSIFQSLSSIFDGDSSEEAKLSTAGHVLDSPAWKSSSAKLLGRGKQEAALPRDSPNSRRLFERWSVNNHQRKRG